MWQLLSPLLGTIDSVLDKIVPDAGQRDKLKFEIQKALLVNHEKELEAATKVIVAEAQGNWLQKSWRPILMLWFAILIGAHWLGFTPDNLSENQIVALLDIVKVGIGGYVLGRSAEKVAKELKR